MARIDGIKGFDAYWDKLIADLKSDKYKGRPFKQMRMDATGKLVEESDDWSVELAAGKRIAAAFPHEVDDSLKPFEFVIDCDGENSRARLGSALFASVQS